MTKIRRTLMVLLLLAVLRLPIALALSALLPDVSQAPVPFYIVTILQELLMFALPAVLLRPWRADRLSRPQHVLPWFLLAVAAAVLARTALSPGTAWWTGFIGATGVPIPVSVGFFEGVLQVLAFGIVPAIVEEMFFRGALLTALLDSCHRVTAVLLTTLMFAFMHGSLGGLPAHLAISLLLTLLMLRSGCILVPIAVHLLYNLLALGWPVLPGWVAGCCGIVLAGVVIALHIGLPRQEQARLSRRDCLLCAAIFGLMAIPYLM